jgi:hypothetical protein
MRHRISLRPTMHAGGRLFRSHPLAERGIDGRHDLLDEVGIALSAGCDDRLGLSITYVANAAIGN